MWRKQGKGLSYELVDLNTKSLGSGQRECSIEVETQNLGVHENGSHLGIYKYCAHEDENLLDMIWFML